MEIHKNGLFKFVQVLIKQRVVHHKNKLQSIDVGFVLSVIVQELVDVWDPLSFQSTTTGHNQTGWMQILSAGNGEDGA